MIKPLLLSAVLFLAPFAQAQTGMNSVAGTVMSALTLMIMQHDNQSEEDLLQMPNAAQLVTFPNVDPVQVTNQAVSAAMAALKDQNIEGAEDPYQESEFQWLLMYLNEAVINRLTSLIAYLTHGQKEQVELILQNFVDDVKEELTGDESGVHFFPESDQSDTDSADEEQPKKAVSRD